MKLSDVKKILQKKIKVIILIGILGAFCSAGIKFFFTPELSLSGDFIYNRIIQVENEKDRTNPNFEFNYLGIINTNNSFLKLIEKTEDKVFDYSKINSGWKRISQQQKVEWLRKRIRMHNFHDNVFEMVFTIPSSNVSDLVYLKNNVDLFMDAFVSNGNKSILEVKPYVTIKTVNSSVIMPVEVKNDKKKIAFKYALYGFIAGVFLSTVVFIGIPLFKKAEG